ncbi:MAG: acyl-CoA thioesterase II [Acidimicrobiaceae bacterium]|nr:acyl-CoA thioesterase II [Acidimicrobiaceae bacterium]
MQTALDNVVALLDLEAIEVNIFRGRSPDDDRQRIFGGQVAGQALVAAARTVERGAVHSLHAYFLRAGDPKAPVLYDVDRIRDGRSFTTRRVVAIQHGRAIFQLAASFHVAEDGYEHLEPMPDVPDPETLESRAERLRAANPDRPHPDRMMALDIRYVTTSPLDRSGPLPPTQRVWMRANGTLGDDEVLHTCLLTYASDMTLLDTTLAPHGTSAAHPGVMLASLDHAMWFHGPFRADEWLLYDQHTPAASGARGLATGRVFTRDGRLVASVVQEGLIRPIG